MKNIDSAFKGLSTVVFRGYQDSNVEKSMLTSKRRIGSFAVRGWFAGKSYSTLARVQSNSTTPVPTPTDLNPGAITGFADAEGCFLITLAKNKQSKSGWVVKLRFQIGLNKKDRVILEQIVNYFGLGKIYVWKIKLYPVTIRI